MTKFQHKIFSVSLALMEVLPLPEDQEIFTETYSTPLIQWRYLIGPGLRAETTFPLDAFKLLENNSYAEAATEIGLTIVKEIVELQRVFFQIVAEQNEGQIAFTETVLRAWIKMLKLMLESESPQQVLDFAAFSFDKLMELHQSIHQEFDTAEYPDYPLADSIQTKSHEELIEKLDSFNKLLKAAQQKQAG